MTKAAAALLALTFAAAPALAAEKWIPLFDGKSLKGWTPKIKGFAAGENHLDTFRVEGGVLKVSYDKYEKFDGKFGHLAYKQPFSHYRLRVEYRFVGDQVAGGPGWAFRNSGIMLHAQSPQSMEKDQDFPVSIEVQFLGGKGEGTGERPTLNLCTPGTHVVLDGKLHTPHCTSSKSKTYHGDGWVNAEVEVRGSKLIKHVVDGQTVLEYTEPQYDDGDPQGKKLIKGGKKLIDKGWIYLQAESHPVEFRKVELLPLKP